MHLQEYFKTQHTFTLTSQHKAELFRQITQKRFQQGVAKWHFLTYKKVSYAFIALVIVLFTFGGVMIEKNGGIDNFFFSSNPINPGEVYADYIAEIIDVNGEWYLQNGKETLSSQYIRNGDILHLKLGSEIIINLDDGSQAKIIGPAECAITKSGEKSYQIVLTEGTFFKIVNAATDNDIDIIAEDMAIHSDKHQALNLQIAKHNGETLVKNTGGTATITSQKDTISKEEKILTTEVIKIKENDITMITPENFSTFLADNNITETLSLLPDTTPETRPTHPSTGTIALATGSIHELSTGTMSTSSGGLNEPSLLARTPQSGYENPGLSALIPPDIESGLFFEENDKEEPINDHIQTDLGLTGTHYKLPSHQQTEVLKTSLNSFFLMNTLEKFVIATREGQSEKRAEALTSLATKINAIATAFDKELTATSLADIRDLAHTLKTELSTEYYLAPSYLAQFEKLGNWCAYLATLSEMGLSGAAVQTEWETLKANLPETLQMR
ncbi:MAG: hypothetical protein LBU27_04810 [Candidatus Peribacteria bacterium]|jgi:hypothetical protein|nr:hypothetical protein [Candidatus Peribacteria bacterium]